MKRYVIPFLLIVVLTLSLFILSSCGECEHDFDELVTSDPTCSVAGEKQLTCKKCGEVKTEAIPATGEHSWSKKGTDTKVATCGEDGNKEYKCLLCDEVKNEPVPATGEHNFVVAETLITADCVTQGAVKVRCTVCGETETQTVPATGVHDYEQIAVLTEPTCYQTGTSSMKCKNCVASTTGIIPATGNHVAGDVAQYDANGHWYLCSTPGCTEKLNSAAHTFVDGTTITASVGCKNGEKNVSCECGYATTAVIVATGAHAYGPFVINDNVATAKCSVCEQERKMAVKYNYDNESDSASLKFLTGVAGAQVTDYMTVTIETDGDNHYQKVTPISEMPNQGQAQQQFQVHSPATGEKGLVSFRVMGTANALDFGLIFYDVSGNFDGVNGNTTKGCNAIQIRGQDAKDGDAKTKFATISDTEFTKITMYYEFDFAAQTLRLDYFVNDVFAATFVREGVLQTKHSSVYLSAHTALAGSFYAIDDFIVAEDIPG